MEIKLSLPYKDFEQLVKDLNNCLTSYSSEYFVRNHITERGFFRIRTSIEEGWNHETKAMDPRGKVTLSIKSSNDSVIDS